MNLQPNSYLQGGKYRIIKTLGQGGFGITYLAEHLLLNYQVAIKEFFMKDLCNRDSDTSHVSVPSVGSKELVMKFKHKFLKEAQNIFKLKHDNIIKVIDVFEENDTAYYVMEYVEGGSLGDRVAEHGAMSENEALHYIHQTADALEYIHSLSINHLDVKPSNILIKENDVVTLIDFGLAKQYDVAGEQTSSTPVGVSRGYAPMEQSKAGGVSSFSPSTDIYSLGATLYKLVTGTTPPEAHDIFDSGLPTLPAHLSAGVKSAITAAMQSSRSARPQTIADFRAILNGNVGTDERTIPVVPPAPVSDFKADHTPKKKKSFITIIVTIIVIISVLGIGILFLSSNKKAVNSEQKIDSISVEIVDSTSTQINEVDSTSIKQAQVAEQEAKAKEIEKKKAKIENKQINKEPAQTFLDDDSCIARWKERDEIWLQRSKIWEYETQAQEDIISTYEKRKKIWEERITSWISREERWKEREELWREREKLWKEIEAKVNAGAVPEVCYGDISKKDNMNLLIPLNTFQQDPRMDVRDIARYNYDLSQKEWWERNDRKSMMKDRELENLYNRHCIDINNLQQTDNEYIQKDRTYAQKDRTYAQKDYELENKEQENKERLRNKLGEYEPLLESIHLPNIPDIPQAPGAQPVLLKLPPLPEVPSAPY